MAKRIRKNGTAMMGRVPVLKYNEIGDIMAEQIDEVIAATEWEKVRKVRVRRDCEKGTNNKQEEI